MVLSNLAAFACWFYHSTAPNLILSIKMFVSVQCYSKQL